MAVTGNIIYWYGDIVANTDGTGLGTNDLLGWALCNGNNGTPNLGGKFIVGYDPLDIDYDTIGNTGGEKEHILTESEMPSHSHTINRIDPDLAGVKSGGISNDDTGSDISSSSSGGDQPHENRPPYYTLACIMKL